MHLPTPQARRLHSPRPGPAGCLVAGFLDAVTGGWGSLTTPTLAAQHHEPRFAIGTAHAAKFMAGGVLAAPLGAWLGKRVQPRPLLLLVGLLVVGLATRTLLTAIGAI